MSRILSIAICLFASIAAHAQHPWPSLAYPDGSQPIACRASNDGRVESYDKRTGHPYGKYSYPSLPVCEYALAWQRYGYVCLQGPAEGTFSLYYWPRGDWNVFPTHTPNLVTCVHWANEMGSAKLRERLAVEVEILRQDDERRNRRR